MQQTNSPLHEGVGHLVRKDLRRIGTSTIEVHDLATLEMVMPVASSRELSRQVPGLSGGEASVETRFAGHRPMSTSR